MTMRPTPGGKKSGFSNLAILLICVWSVLAIVNMFLDRYVQGCFCLLFAILFVLLKWDDEL